MKIAVLSDVHGNRPALQVVLEDMQRWQPVNGDLINRGPCSLQVLQLLLQTYPQSTFLKGNHESFVIACGTKDEPRTGPIYEIRRFTHWTYAQMGQETSRIAAWDDSLDLDDLDGGSLHITHGTRLGNRDGITPRTKDHELPDKLGDKRDLFITSHTHWPFIREFNGTTVVNSGSVGSPFDSDYRASYIQLSFSRGRWYAEIIRLDYDRVLTELDYKQSGFMDAGGPITRIMLMELRHSRGLIAHWMRNYEAAVLGGEITLEQSVERHLNQMLGTSVRKRIISL
jgi:predicted phosphodiesterase